MQNRRNKSFSSYHHARTTPGPTNTRDKKSYKFPIIIGLVIVVCAVMVRGDKPTSQSDTVQALAKPTVVKTVKPLPKFPAIDTSKLTPIQKDILAIVKEEYYKRPVSFDQTVMKYTEGFEESWCADYISWVRDRAGIPFVHPETGYWRLPGVSTVNDYYRSSDAYFEVGEYTPKLGDTAFYYGETPDGTNSEHIALVLGVKGDQLITIGGNETRDGIMQIRYNKLESGVRGLLGFGRTNVN